MPTASIFVSPLRNSSLLSLLSKYRLRPMQKINHHEMERQTIKEDRDQTLTNARSDRIVLLFMSGASRDRFFSFFNK
jgi:hypothetical protein